MAMLSNSAASTIAIVGAGFSGTLLALHLLRRCPPSVSILLIERNSQFGRGQAYSTGNPAHLLNVPAGRMSAFHDEPRHFLDWLQAHPDAVRSGDLPASPEWGSFVPRRLYGAYIRSLLKDEIRRDPRRRLELIRGEVLGIDRTGHPLRLALDRGREATADFAVLAIGNFPPAPVPVADPSFYDSPYYRSDPWAPDTLAGLDPESPVLVIGTGLTTVDLAISLLDQGHRGTIHAISRRGLLPCRHAAGAAPHATARQEFPVGVRALLRHLRYEAERASASGGSWQAVIDELRPFTQDIWQLLSPEERRRFLRHVRPWWDVHRHRMPPEVADRIEAARAAGQLRVRAARIRGYRIVDGTVEVMFQPQRQTGLEIIRVARVINCSGPGADYDRITHPLVRSLLEDGTARPDALRLGLDVTNTGALLHRAGTISRRLFALGPVTKGAFWEITAVPDIRRQAELLAQHLATLVRVPAAEPAPEPKVLHYAI
jgi:uncharacterized NAD(P)/FAD-binding protein YdhS